MEPISGEEATHTYILLFFKTKAISLSPGQVIYDQLLQNSPRAGRQQGYEVVAVRYM